jgi:urease accessory protein
MMKKLLSSGIVLALFSNLAMAHPGHDLVSAYAGFLHPFTGWDHLLVMVAIGIWAAKIGGAARWLLPLAFLITMTVGALLGFNDIHFAQLESGVAASVIAMGVLLLIQLPISLVMRVVFTSVFALLHGMAHGTELITQDGLGVLCGMLIATALLHGIGLLLGMQKWPFQRIFNNTFAYGLILFGIYTLT